MKFNAKRAREAGKRSGAVRKEKSVIVEGMAAAAARVDLSVEALSAARKAGCRAFKPGNRVNIAELETWLLENGDIVNEGESLNAIRRREHPGQDSIGANRSRCASCEIPARPHGSGGVPTMLRGQRHGSKGHVARRDPKSLH